MSQNKDIKPLKRSVGCPQCSDSGYLGRTPIYELLPVGKSLVDAIANDSSRKQIADIVATKGLLDLRSMAKGRVLAGETSVDEFMRIIGSELD